MYQTIPVDVFEDKLRHVDSVYDMIRITYSGVLTDEDIERIIEESVSAARIPYGHSVRPGYKDVITASAHRPFSKQPIDFGKLQKGTLNSHPPPNPFMMSDQPMTDFHIPYNYKKFTIKRRLRRHHRRKDTVPSGMQQDAPQFDNTHSQGQIFRNSTALSAHHPHPQPQPERSSHSRYRLGKHIGGNSSARKTASARTQIPTRSRSRRRKHPKKDKGEINVLHDHYCHVTTGK